MTDIIEKDDDVQIVDNSDIIESSIIEREPVATINESTPEAKTGTALKTSFKIQSNEI